MNLNPTNKAYLGDSVFVQADAFVTDAIILTTEDDGDLTNAIVLVPDVQQNLLRYLKVIPFPARKEREL